jgi:uncharacterized pyridoxal phosphate-containing UPF0001 family protein
MELAEVISRQCQNKNLTQSILIQVNLAHEESKTGFDRHSLELQWAALTQLPGLKINGLMTMPPLTETGEEVRPYFKELRELRQELQSKTDRNRHPMNELSMGTSADYLVAVQEGSSLVRLGTILFCERPVKR